MLVFNWPRKSGMTMRARSGFPDQDTNEWFFIEMNPRIQVEHTVTEQITGIDIVRSQILVAMDQPLHGKKIGIPSQENILEMGVSQCRVTTEDPEKGFTPDCGKILKMFICRFWCSS